MALAENHKTLEVEESGTWDDLFIAYRDFTAPPMHPSGSRGQALIPYRFPASVQITGLGALSDAIVCKERWDAFATNRERDIVLSRNFAFFNDFITAWHKTTV